MKRALILALLGVQLVSTRALAIEPGAAEALLAGHATRADVVFWLGNPVRCIEIPVGRTICEWHLSNRRFGWESLARAIGTKKQVALQCVFDGDGKREPGSCAGYPRYTNREKFKRIYARKRRTQDPRDVALDAVRAAGDVQALSRVLGAIPVSCELSVSDLLCTWRGSKAAYGHGTMALFAATDPGHRVTLQCRLPADGSRRQARSCRAEAGYR